MADGKFSWRIAQGIEMGRPSISHLRSSSEVIGYGIEAKDGSIGKVEDLVIDDET